MLFNALLVFHIAVLGYWLGSELVINHTYRYVSWAKDMPFAERDRLMDHVLDVDQHVRYALILQAGLGTALAALLGYFPGGTPLAISAAVLAAVWLGLAEATHRLRRRPAGRVLAHVDQAVRYLMIAALLALGGSALTGYAALPAWLSWKLVLFAGVIACGLSIRVWIVRFYRIWGRMAAAGSSDEDEQHIRRTYVAATATLAALWALIGVIVYLSVWKP